VIRCGGEEFLIVLPACSISTCYERAELIRLTIKKTPILYGENSLQCTASFGIASSIPNQRPFDALLKLADEALYVAKRSGRNKVLPKIAIE